VLKACNQAIIAPAVIELTLNIGSKVAFKDGGGWRISITLRDHEVIIEHWKRQRHVVVAPLSELFQYFEWRLSLSFDRKIEQPKQFGFYLSDIIFNDGVNETKQAEVRKILDGYFNKTDSQVSKS